MNVFRVVMVLLAVASVSTGFAGSFDKDAFVKVTGVKIRGTECPNSDYNPVGTSCVYEREISNLTTFFL